MDEMGMVCIMHWSDKGEFLSENLKRRGHLRGPCLDARMLSRVWVSYKTGSGLDDWIY
jgi:hypothetical protein